MNVESSESHHALRMGLLIPQFPTQTHVAMWRVGQAMRRLNVQLQMLSTRRPDASETCHEALRNEQADTFYAWPPGVAAVKQMLGRPQGVARCVQYLAGLHESSTSERLQTARLLPAAAALAAFCRRRRIDHILVHSCADAAHVAAMAHLMGGPAYTLRLGGDLAVYGKDHASKMRHATLIVAAAAVNRDEVLERVGLPADRVIDSPLGVDTTRFTPGRAKQDASGILRLLSVSRIHKNKGLLDILEAIRRLLDQGVSIRFRMGGAGPHEDMVRQRIAALNLGDHVELLGPLDEARVIEELQQADAFVLASVGVGEGSPVAVIEAMACGLPVICTRIGGTADMVTDGVEGMLVEPHDVQGLAEAMQTLAQDPGLRQRLGAAARHRAEQRYDCVQVARRILKRIFEQGGVPAGVPEPAASTIPTTEAA